MHISAKLIQGGPLQLSIQYYSKVVFLITLYLIAVRTGVYDLDPRPYTLISIPNIRAHSPQQPLRIWIRSGGDDIGEYVALCYDIWTLPWLRVVTHLSAYCIFHNRVVYPQCRPQHSIPDTVGEGAL